MKPDELIKLMDNGYATGDTGCIAKNWHADLQATVLSPVEDTLAFYLASWVGDHLEGIRDQSDLQTINSLLAETESAIQDLDKLRDALVHYAFLDLMCKFITQVANKPRELTPDLVELWLSLVPDLDNELCSNVMAHKIFSTSCDLKLGDGICSSKEGVAEILAGLMAQKAALLKDKAPAPPEAESQPVPVEVKTEQKK